MINKKTIQLKFLGNKIKDGVTYYEIEALDQRDN